MRHRLAIQQPVVEGLTRHSPLATRHYSTIRNPPRGVTLVEMLVTLAILLLMMTAIVKIFQAATGALNAAQVYQELDNQLRLLDSTIRSDLNGVTARLTPPNNPNNNLGYLEYGENEFADVQGEDSDDYIRFTAKAPAGQPFTGRMWIRAAVRSSTTVTPPTSLPSRSRSPANTPRSSTSCAMAISTVACCSWHRSGSRRSSRRSAT